MLLYQPLGDCGLQIEFSTTIDKLTIMRIRSFQDRIESKAWEFVLECVMGYSTLTIFYKPMHISFEEIVALCKRIEHELEYERNQQECNGFVSRTESKIIEIPVLYGGEHGPDLEDVARLHGLTPEQVIEIHSQPNYLIYFIGFTPGFPYFGGMSNKIAAPRLSTPRRLVKAGSVGIADQQTGIYPIDSPGGWRIIGRTPWQIFDPDRETSFLLKAGDVVKFKPITREVYLGGL